MSNCFSSISELYAQWNARWIESKVQTISQIMIRFKAHTWHWNGFLSRSRTKGAAFINVSLNHVFFSSSRDILDNYEKNKRNLRRCSTFIKRKGSRKSNAMKCCIYLAFVWHRLDAHTSMFNISSLCTRFLFFLLDYYFSFCSPQQHKKQHRKFSEIIMWSSLFFNKISLVPVWVK